MSATLEVVTKPRTMSGYRGGLRLTLDASEARKWIERGWAVPAEKPAEKRHEGSRRKSERVNEEF